MMVQNNGLSADKNLFWKPMAQKVVLPLERICDKELQKEKENIF
jgi:hypothetical protein